LRNGGDTGRTQDAPILLTDLSGQTVPAAAVHPAPAIAAPLRHEIETVLGDGPTGGTGNAAGKGTQ
jgi:hypothetical protein